MSDEVAGPENLEQVVDHLESKVAGEKETFSFNEALAAFEGRTFGPLLILPAMLALVPPISMIPFVPSTMGIIIALMSAQYLLGRSHPWVPAFIGNKTVEKEKVLKLVEKCRPWAKWVDGFLGTRLQVLVEGPMERVIAGICVLLALTMPICEIIPGLAAVPSTAILCLGLAITAKDGLLGLVGILVATWGIGFLVFRLPEKLMEWFG